MQQHSGEGDERRSKKWLLYFQEKGIKFENVSSNRMALHIGTWEFKNDPKDYLITAQPVPDIPDWREVCREMQSKGVEFEAVCGDESWKKSRPYFFPDFMGKEYYRIPQQSLPEWREEMTEETKPDPREEIPHRELRIQWHEDMLHHLRTGEPMTVWEFRFKVAKEKSGWLEFGSSEIPAWDEGEEYRRKPRTITYWHCVVIGTGDLPIVGRVNRDDVVEQCKQMRIINPTIKFSPITETTVEVEN